MRSLLRQFKRAPGRIVASVFALALAVGAIGVLAVPTVSTGTLHETAERDGLADIIVPTSPLDAEQVAELATIDNVVAAEGQASLAVTLPNGSDTRVVGLDLEHQTMDLLQLDAGRLPQSSDEIVTSPGFGTIGERLFTGGRSYEIVGHGSTLWWADSDVAFADLDTVRQQLPEQGTNRLVITAEHDDLDSLRAISDEVRTVLADSGDTYTDFPLYLPDGTTPIDQDIEQISMLIGLLGIAAGLVALVLLASTTNTLITERTREVAVMRALGGRSRPLRRRLRRIATGITVIALVVGLPLGIVISNVIARMVLEEFVGVTPDVAIDWLVLAGSAVGMLVGARLVAARAARRVTKIPLAAALRDREGAPFGRSWAHRAMARVPAGGLFGRLAGRSAVHKPARTVAIVVQISAAVGAAFLIPSLVTSVNEFNTATHAPWQWESLTGARDPGLPIDGSIEDDHDGIETGIWTEGEIEEWQVDVYGLAVDTAMFDPMLSDGSWIEPEARTAVLSKGFASRNDLHVGDDVTLTLAGGPVEYEVVGLSNDFSRTIYVDRADLSADLGAPGMANVVLSDHAGPGVTLPVATWSSTADDIAAEDNAGREAVVVIFGAIGVVVAGVAALAVISSMTVSLYERRHEFAALQALGARRRRLRGLLVRELAPVGALGLVGGLAIGALGTRGIIGSFEASNAVDIGVVDATGAIPAIVIGTFATLALLAVVIVHTAARRPVAVTLRGAA
ncbi:MAG: ABC transporter permease [Ilumatobacter sp.]|uniref:ABC transporter permease n=1 Tax=Ilumatobacter sp. TaxID=1967498 RepID=UPI0026141AD2|nr:ABC transporter permease [Ilumatobacter sp.]MDJ0769301.1 ABC transporter permease [Ilumatobacter sp.]